MTGQNFAAVCVVLCVLAATASSYVTELRSKYYDDYSFPRPAFQTDEAPDGSFQTDQGDHVPDDYHGQKIDTDSNEMMHFPTDTAGVQGDFDPSKIKITEEGDKICVSYSVFKVCFKKSEASELICGLRLGSTLTLGCRIKDEENYLGLCYKKCSILTDKSHPLRTATNTCAKNGCGPNEEEDAGLCYPKCKPYYKAVGPVCWGYCSHFCGSNYDDLGLYCYRWWPPHACNKPSYGRGVGTLPYAPWTEGFGCNGFGINGDGGCALIDVLNYITLPYGIKCP